MEKVYEAIEQYKEESENTSCEEDYSIIYKQLGCRFCWFLYKNTKKLKNRIKK